MPRRIPILLYHEIGPPVAGPLGNLVVSPETFALHLRALARRGYRSIDLEEWVSAREDPLSLPERPVLLTFDDGYRGLYEHAAPILEACSFRATVFLVTSRLGGCNDWDDTSRSGPLPLLELSQVRDMAARGFSFQSHGRTHASLPLLSRDDAADQIEASRKGLEDCLGTAVRHFAYPFGHFTPRIRDQVLSAGYRTACSTLPGRSSLAGDPFALPRVMVNRSDGVLALALRMLLGGGRSAILSRVRGWYTRTGRSGGRVGGGEPPPSIRCHPR